MQCERNSCSLQAPARSSASGSCVFTAAAAPSQHPSSATRDAGECSRRVQRCSRCSCIGRHSRSQSRCRQRDIRGVAAPEVSWRAGAVQPVAALHETTPAALCTVLMFVCFPLLPLHSCALQKTVGRGPGLLEQREAPRGGRALTAPLPRLTRLVSAWVASGYKSRAGRRRCGRVAARGFCVLFQSETTMQLLRSQWRVCPSG